MEEQHSLVSAVDLFCGAGGLSEGLSSAGISVQAGIDNDPACEFPFTENQKADFYLRDIRQVEGSEVIEMWDDNLPFTLLAGCAPCQPFSTLRKAGAGFSGDSRWDLLLEFERLIRETTPTFVTMENVPRINGTEILDQFIDTLLELGYKVSFQIVSLQDFNLPQSRRRFVLIASLLDLIEVPKIAQPYSKTQTVRDIIGKLPKLKAGEIDPKDSLHKASRLSPLNLERIIQSVPGGTWRDWEDQTLVLECHKRESGKYYSSVYGRMDWESSPTITTQFFNYGTGRFGHPEQNRAISLREGALLQGFPPNYSFSENESISFSKVGRLIGNAVPPPIGKAVGTAIMQQANGFVH